MDAKPSSVSTGHDISNNNNNNNNNINLSPPPPYEQSITQTGSSVEYTPVVIFVPVADQPGIRVDPLASAINISSHNISEQSQQQQQQGQQEEAFATVSPRKSPMMSPTVHPVSTPTAPSASASNYQPKFEISSKGIESDDKVLNEDPKALLDFYVKHCTPPSLSVQIRGHHLERRSRQVSRTYNGRTTFHTEYYDVDVTDFLNTLDLTPFINPTGTIYTVADENGKYNTVQQLIEEYVTNENKLKALVLEKHVNWNFEKLTQAIYGAIRFTGYVHQIEVAFPTTNNQMTVYSSNVASKCARSSLTRIFCVLSCLWIFGLPLYLALRKRFSGQLKANFQMNITEKDWYQRNYYSIVNGAGGVHIMQPATNVLFFAGSPGHPNQIHGGIVTPF